MFESPNDALNLLFIILIPMLITAAVTAVFSAISTLAVYYYNKSRSVKEKSATYFLIFLGGILGVIIYYFVTKKKKDNLDRIDENKIKKFRIISILLMVIAAIGFGANIYASQTGMYDTDEYKRMMEEANTISYDMYDKDYIDSNMLNESADGTLQE